MKILVVSQGLHLGGRERFTAWLPSVLAQRGHAVTLAVRNPPQRDHYDVAPQVTVVRLFDRFSPSDVTGTAPTQTSRTNPRRPRRIVRRVYRMSAFMRRVRQTVSAEQPDVVIAIGTHMSLSVLAALWGTSVPVVVTEREHPFAFPAPRMLERLRVLLYQRAAEVVVLLEEIAEQAREQWQLQKVTAIGNAATFTPADTPPLEQRPPVVLALGRLSPVKGLPSLLRAWHASTARQRGWRLRLVGEGPQRGELAHLVSQLGLTESVELPGAVSDVTAEYRNARVFVLPSLTEGFGNSLLEAMTFGCACIATNCPGGPRLLLDGGHAGVLVDVGDVAALSAALERLTTDAHLIAVLGEAAMLRSRDFDAATVVDAWESVLERAVGRVGGRHGEG